MKGTFVGGLLAAAAMLLLIGAPAQAAGANASGKAGKQAKKALKKTKKNQKAIKKNKRAISALTKVVDDISDAIDEIAGTPGPQGPQGPQGPPGDDSTTSDFVKLASGNSQTLLTSEGITYSLTCTTEDDPYGTDPSGTGVTDYTVAEIEVASVNSEDYFLYMGDAEFYPLGAADWFFNAYDNTGGMQFFADDAVVSDENGTVHSVEAIIGANTYGSDCVGQVTLIPREIG